MQPMTPTLGLMFVLRQAISSMTSASTKPTRALSFFSYFEGREAAAPAWCLALFRPTFLAPLFACSYKELCQLWKETGIGGFKFGRRLHQQRSLPATKPLDITASFRLGTCRS